MAKHILISRPCAVPLTLRESRLNRLKYLGGALSVAVLCGPSLARRERGWDGSSVAVKAQAFRFSLRAEPDIITANGISTTSITVQVPDSGSAFSASPTVRFVTSAGSIESQARVVGGVARALLRSSTTPGTAIVTAFIGNSREEIAVEFSSDEVSLARYLQIDGSYVAYNASGSTITASGKCALDYGDLHIESDVRLDVDLQGERVWAQGSSGRVLIRNSKSGQAHTLRGDRLYYDISRRRGVMRRVDTGLGPARQEFMDSDFRALPPAQVALPARPSAAPARPGLPGSGISPARAALGNSGLATEPAAPDNVQAGNIVGRDEPQNLVRDSSTAASLPVLPEPASGNAPNAQTEAAPSQSPLLTAEEPVTAEEPASSSEPASADSPTADSEATPPGPDAASAPASAPATDAAGGAQPSASTYSVPGASGSAGGAGGIVLDSRLPGLPGVLPGGLGSSSGTAPGAEEAPLREVPAYSPLPSEAAPDASGVDTSAAPGQAASRKAREPEQIEELEPPHSGSYGGYWVTARKIRIFAHDKIQFEKAAVYFNGQKLFGMPRYVASLSGSFNPASDIASFNSAGGLSINFPYYYMASARGTGTMFLQLAPRNGFSSQASGPALAFDQQYWLSDNSQGRLLIDQIGHAWNLNWSHQHQFSPSMRGSLYLDMPRHTNAYLRSTLVKDTSVAQFGFEGLLSRVRDTPGSPGDRQAQFYARLRPRTIGKSGWSYSVGANLIALRQFALLSGPGSGGGTGGGGTGGGTGGGGTGTGGGTRPGGVRPPGSGPRRLEGQVADEVRPSAMRALISMRAAQATAASTYRASTLVGQTLLTTLQSPTARVWRGGSISGSVLASAFNYSDGRRGLAPGLTIGFQQSLGRAGGLQIDYNFDRGGLSSVGGLYSSSYANFASANLFLNVGQRANLNAYFTRSFSDGGTYGAATLDFYPIPKWRMGLFSDYSRFDDIPAYLDYGLSVGRQVGQREISINWSRNRGKVYVELGGSPY